MGICWNHTSLPISFLQLSIQFSLLQNTYPSVPEFQDFHSSNLENVCIKFFFSCRRLHYSNSQTLHVAMNSSWIRHGAVDTFATICSSALLSVEPSSLPKPLFKKAHNIYSILSTILYNSMLLLWWSFTVHILACSFPQAIFQSSLFLHLHHQATSAIPIPWQYSYSPDPLRQSPLTPKLVHALKITICSHKPKHRAEDNPAPNTAALATLRTKENVTY